MRTILSAAAVLLLAAAGVRAQDPDPLSPSPARLIHSGCADDPAAWAPGLGLESKKHDAVGPDLLARCRERRKPRPGFPSGAPDDGLTGVVASDPVTRAKALRQEAEDYSRTQALQKRVGALKNPWGDAAQPEAAPAADAAGLLSPATAAPPAKFQKVRLTAPPADTSRFVAAAVPKPVPRKTDGAQSGWKGKICEELPQFVSPKVTWCHPAAP